MMTPPVSQPVFQVAPTLATTTYQPVQSYPYYYQPQPYSTPYYGLPAYGFPGFGCPAFMPGCFPSKLSLGEYVADDINYSRVFDGFSYLDPAQAFRQRWPYVGF